MPKAIQYTKGSIIYFDGDMDDRVFIMQKGAVLLTSADIETGAPVSEQVRSGEFFGVKSALGHFAREETATALVTTVAVALTVQEFEVLFSNNKSLIMKMLRVFSNQLRQIHRKTESILKSRMVDQQSGMLTVAKSFYDDEQFRSACDVYLKFMRRFPDSAHIDAVKKWYNAAKLRADRLAAMNRGPLENPEDFSSSLKIFDLPAFSRFAKDYEPGEVIISEFEPGDSFYFIQKGNVQLVKCVNGTKKNLDILRPGEFFGEMAILDNSPRSATCVASGAVRCLEFNKENFALLITGNPQMALLLLKLFCKRIYDQKRRLKILVIKDLQAKIAGVFLLLDEMNPPDNPSDKQRTFNVTVSDIAHWAGLSYDVTKEEITYFVERQRIKVLGNSIVVSNINDIQRIYETRCDIR